MLLKQMMTTSLATGGAAAQRLPFVILASATINLETYSKFFELPPANVFHIVGRQHGIDERWPAVGTNDYQTDSAKTAAKIHSENAEDPFDQRDILIFAPGALETMNINTVLLKMQKQGELDAGGPVVILTLNREIVNDELPQFSLVKAPAEALWNVLEGGKAYTPEQLQAFKAEGKHPRRIIVSTVIAETGLTIETLKYVIDNGWNRSSENYQPYGVGGLVTRPAAQSRIKQREGRAGRLFPGVFYPLYTRNVYDSLPKQQMPDIVTEGAGPIILDIILGQLVKKTLQAPIDAKAKDLEFRIQDLDMLNSPPVDALASAIEEVTVLGFFAADAPLFAGQHATALTTQGIDPEPVSYGYGLTRMGRIAAKFQRLPLPQRRLLMSAQLWECSVSDLATMAAVVQKCGSRGGLSEMQSREQMMKKVDFYGAALDNLVKLSLPHHTTLKRARSLYAPDDIVEGLLVFEAYREELCRAVKGKSLVGDMDAWCLKMGLEPQAMFQVASLREAALEEMVAAGLNPFWGAEHRLVKQKDAETFAAKITGLKRCIYDAYRLSVLTPDPKDKVYRTRYGMPAVVRGQMELVGAQKTLLAPSIVLAAVRRTKAQRHAQLRWELSAPMVSSVAHIDRGLVSPQSGPAPGFTSPTEMPAATARIRAQMYVDLLALVC